ncbi:MAG TPA: biotin/lipoyl-containing protein [Kofleriaceae bacterium]|nr:biotin/lipoyl-containing protein [Kofleriaceae bacterium]
MNGRVFEPTLTARVELEGDRVIVRCPAVGLWRGGPAVGAVIAPGASLGELEVLGVLHRVVAPSEAHGRVLERAHPGQARVALGFGDSLLVLDPSAGVDRGVVAAAAASAADTTGLVFVAPTSGRFYDRPAPGKAPFVEVGAEIASGHTICLLEVMKTFNRVTYGGDGLPPRARVTAIRPANEDDLEAGAVILELEVL